MSAQHAPSIAKRTIGVVLLLWFILAVIAWNAADTRPIPPSVGITNLEPAATSDSAKTKIALPKLQPPVAVELDHGPNDLLTAVQTRHPKAVLRLISDSRQIQLADAHGDTPLHYAVRNEMPLLAQLLLVHGADPLHANNTGLIPVQLMPRGKYQSYRYKPEQRDVLDRFIEHQHLASQAKQQASAKVQAVFNYAALHGEFETARAALVKGADPTMVPGRMKRTLLHLNQTATNVDSYLALGIPINARDKDGRTALSLALFKGRDALAEALLEAGAEISTTENYSDLGYAVGKPNAKGDALTRLLLEHGAIPDQREWMTAISSKNTGVVNRLMRQSGGFDPETTDGANRIKRAQQISETKVLDAMRRDARIDSYVNTQSVVNKVERTQALASLSLWLAPHVLSLAAIIILLACFSLAPILLLNKSMRWNLLLGGLSATLFVHLFLFNQSVESALSQFRFFGEPTPAFRIGLMIIGDGLAFIIGAAIGIAWSLLPKRNLQSSGTKSRVAILTVYLACFGILVGHNLGSIQWPSKVYRTISGYDAYTQRKAEEANKAKLARNATYALKKQKQKNNQPPYTALFDAIKANDNVALKAAIASQVDINIRDNKGDSAVHKVMYPPRPVLLQTLIEAGAALDTPAERGRQPIHRLVTLNFSENSLPLLEQLLNAGVNPNAIDANRMTPLCLTLTSKKPRLGYLAAKMLLSAGADINPEPNCAPVALTKNVDVLRWIVQQGAELDRLQTDHYLQDKYGAYQASALWSAAYDGDAKRCQTLIDLGADVERRDTKWGSTPLQAGLSGRHRDIAKKQAVARVLISAGADTTARAWDGRSASDFDTKQQLPSLLATANE